MQSIFRQKEKAKKNNGMYKIRIILRKILDSFKKYEKKKINLRIEVLYKEITDIINTFDQKNHKQTGAWLISEFATRLKETKQLYCLKWQDEVEVNDAVVDDAMDIDMNED